MRNSLYMAVLVVTVSLNSQLGNRLQRLGKLQRKIKKLDKLTQRLRNHRRGKRARMPTSLRRFNRAGIVDASGHPHFQLTPEGDVVTPPGAGPKSQANAKIAGAGARGIPATPAFPCPPRPVPTPLPKADKRKGITWWATFRYF